jgi:acetyl esterase/lipase
MENQVIELWENPPYIQYTKNNFKPSLTEYKVNNQKTAVIVCPGGAYGWMDGERYNFADMLNKGNINAYVLDYNVAPCHKFAPLSDVQRAVRILRSMGYKKVAVLGYSAGGHLCCTSATMYKFEAYPKTDDIDKFSARPDAFIPCYPVVTMDKKYTHLLSRQNLLGAEWEDEVLAKMFSIEKHITKRTPPCFVWHTATDDLVSVENTLMLASALAKKKVYFEMHIYPIGRHGVGLATGTDDVSTWTTNVKIFLHKLGF